MSNKLVSTKIQIPAIPENCPPEPAHFWNADRFNIGFSRLKYLVIFKFMESKRNYKRRGVLRRTRDYGVGILTEENDYYFSMLTMNHRHLMAQHITLFNKMFMQRFVVTENTRVLFSDDIGWKTEPIGQYWKIVQDVLRFRINHVSMNKMFKGVNRYHRTIRTWKHRRFGRWHWELLIDSLFKNNCFGFITDPDWEEKLSKMNPRIRNMHVYVAVGILYLRVLDVYYDIRQRYIKRKEEEKLNGKKSDNEKKVDEKELRDNSPWDVVL